MTSGEFLVLQQTAEPDWKVRAEFFYAGYQRFFWTTGQDFRWTFEGNYEIVRIYLIL